MVVKWNFLDPTDSTTASFEINPNDGGTPSHIKNITTTNTLASGGRTLLFEGSVQAQEITFSGVSLTATQLAMLLVWFTKKHQIQLTDDLGRVMMIYITKFEPKRVRKASNFQYHTYSVTANIVDWP